MMRTDRDGSSKLQGDSNSMGSFRTILDLVRQKISDLKHVLKID